MSLNSVNAQEMVSTVSLTRKTIILEPRNMTPVSITVVPLASAIIPAGTTMAQSSIELGGDTYVIHRPAAADETRSGILMTDIAARPTVSTPPVQADLVGAVMHKRGTFKKSNIIDEGVQGTLQPETLAMTHAIFK